MAKRPETVTVEISLFHVFVLPTLWLVDTLWLWIAYSRVGGDNALAPYVLGWVGWWLGFIAMRCSSIVPFILLNSIGGVLAMALIGFIQDWLHVRKWGVIAYPGLVILLAVYAGVLGKGFPESSGDFMRSLLATFCVSIYVVSFLSCLLALGWWIVRKWCDSRWRPGWRFFVIVVAASLVICLALAGPRHQYDEAIRQGQQEWSVGVWVSNTGGKVVSHHERAPYERLFTCFGLFGKNRRYCVDQVVLDRTKVGDQNLRWLRSLTHLKRLSLEGTSVTDEGVLQLTSLGELEELNLRNTKVTNAAVDKLRKSIPGVKVVLERADAASAK